jgi:hypothetical protein
MLYRKVKQGKMPASNRCMLGLRVNWPMPLGNERFGDVTPWEEVCLGAEQHECWPHCLGTCFHAQSADRSSLELPRDAEATACEALAGHQLRDSSFHKGAMRHCCSHSSFCACKLVFLLSGVRIILF